MTDLLCLLGVAAALGLPRAQLEIDGPHEVVLDKEIGPWRRDVLHPPERQRAQIVLAGELVSLELAVQLYPSVLCARLRGLAPFYTLIVPGARTSFLGVGITLGEGRRREVENLAGFD